MNLKRIFLNKRFILVLIILNAIIIFIQEFKNIPGFIYYIDNVFTIIFFMELIVKIKHYGIRNFLQSNWNRFDMVIILLATLSLFLSILPFDFNDSLSFVTSLRILRIFKSFRLIKLVPDIHLIINGVNRAIKTSYIIVLAFLILLFIVSVFTCSLYKNIAPEYFDNPMSSLYSIFRVFSIEGWYEIPDLIAERSTVFIGFLSKLYFVLLLFFGGILGMSLINSIFVDTMVSDNNDDLEKEIKNLSKRIEELTQEIQTIKSNKNRL